ncbi:Protein FAM161A [Dissostichus eleginoides]|uniref:Protein FAM161A n=1 Tax=Dissostichus eleginoides TaxID=100907 RepID=A0AAD9BQX8_DISEL|nr:Protein FAM161A [Dissostichus eleginoides]
MANAHRTNVLVTSCLKTPREYEDSGSDFCEEDYVGRGGALMLTDYRAAGDRLDLSEIFFSNEEYYSKLEELKKAHLRTMAELEGMYRRKLQLKASEPPGATALQTDRHRVPWSHSSPAASRHLRKSQSAVELRRSSPQSDYSDEEEETHVERGLVFSPKEHIKNMWQDFKLSPKHLSASSMQSLPADQKKPRKGRGKKRQEHKDREQENLKHKSTVPEPFQMMLREDERRKRGIKSRSEIEQENADLRRQLEELTECQRKFRASPIPAHVHLPLYEDLQGRKKREAVQPRTLQKPFSFLERERLKKEQKEQHPSPNEDKVKPFRAKPVPRSVYAAATGEQMKEEQLYRSIKIQMRAQEMLHSAAMPPSMLTRQLSDRKKNKDGSSAAGGDNNISHKPHIHTEMPDFDARYRRFQKHLEKQKEVKPTTTCEPFELRTSHISSHRERILADIEKEQSSPKAMRWPHVSPGKSRTANSSLCSSLSGSLEILPGKVTDATKKRHDAVRKVRTRANSKNSGNKGFSVAQRNAKQAAEKRYADALQGCDLTEDFISSKAAGAGSEHNASESRDSTQSEQEEPDMGYKPVHYRKVSLGDNDVDPEEKEGGSEVTSQSLRDSEDASSHHSDQDSDGSYHYSDDHENYSDDSEHTLTPQSRKKGSDGIEYHETSGHCYVQKL